MVAYILRWFCAGFANTGESWRELYVEPTKNYTDANFMKDIDRIWKQLQPLYEQLHAYVRRELIKQYPTAKIHPKGPIPAHLLGTKNPRFLGKEEFNVQHAEIPGILNVQQLFIINAGQLFILRF